MKSNIDTEYMSIKSSHFLLIVVAIILGSFLRLFQITDQVVADDEWHSIHALLFREYNQIFTSFGISDHCIPLTVFYKFLSETIGLSETLMRFPQLFFGITSILIFPIFCREIINRKGMVIFALLLSISPLLIFFSRYIRPYSITVFLSFIGVMAFYKWWVGGKKKYAFLYVVCAALGSYFHLVVIPFLLAPFLFATGQLFFTEYLKRVSELKRILKLAIVTLISIVILVGPPLYMNYFSIEKKIDAQTPSVSIVVHMATLFSGTSSLVLTGILFIISIFGLAKIFYKEKPFALYMAVVSLIHLLSILFIRPSGIVLGTILARYLLPVLPVFLLLVSIGLAEIRFFFNRRVHSFSVLLSTVFLCSLLFYFGPIPRTYYHPNNWTNHMIFQANYNKAENAYVKYLKPKQIPGFYYKLGSLKANSITIVEAPWRYEWQANELPFYQMIHKQKTLIGFVNDLCADEKFRLLEIPKESKGMNFKNYVFLSDYEKVISKGVEYIIFHKTMRGDKFSDTDGTPIDVLKCKTKIAENFGEPVLEEQDIIVYQIKKTVF